MLESVLNNQVKYSINKKIDDDDIGSEASVYKLQLYETEVCVILGNIKREFINFGILYVPVYVVISSKVIERIGYFEFYTDNVNTYYDKEGDLDVSIMEGPLVFSYIDNDYLLNLVKKSKFISEIEVEEEKYLTRLEEKKSKDGEIIEKAEKIIEEGKKQVVVDKIETIENIERILSDDESKYNPKHSILLLKQYNKEAKENPIQSESSWIQKYYDNNKFGIIDNEGNGDCLFATIRDGLADLNISINVASLRHLQAKNVNQEQFGTYKTIYDSLVNEITEIKSKIATRKKFLLKEKKKYKDIREKINQLIKEGKRNEVNEQQKIMISIKKNFQKINAIYKKLNKNLKKTSENLNEFSFMREIDTLEQLQSFMKTSNFWADSATISRLEVLLNLKIIILSEEDWFDKNYNSILKCGDMVNTIIENKGYFKPKYYLIVSYTGNHYKLITYNNKKIFNFKELPYVVKEEIVEKCLQSKGKNIFEFISQFVGFKNDIITITEIVNEVNKIKKMNISPENLLAQINILNEKIRQNQNKISMRKMAKINNIINKQLNTEEKNNSLEQKQSIME